MYRYTQLVGNTTNAIWYIHVYIHTYIYTCIIIYIHIIHIHIYMYMYVYTCIYMYRPSVSGSTSCFMCRLPKQYRLGHSNDIHSHTPYGQITCYRQPDTLPMSHISYIYVHPIALETTSSLGVYQLATQLPPYCKCTCTGLGTYRYNANLLDMHKYYTIIYL